MIVSHEDILRKAQDGKKKKNAFVTVIGFRRYRKRLKEGPICRRAKLNIIYFRRSKHGKNCYTITIMFQHHVHNVTV